MASAWVGNDTLGWPEFPLFSEDKADNTWHFYDIAAPTHLTTAPVSVLFVSSLEQSTAQWYVDDVEFITPTP